MLGCPNDGPLTSSSRSPGAEAEESDGELSGLKELAKFCSCSSMSSSLITLPCSRAALRANSSEWTICARSSWPSCSGRSSSLAASLFVSSSPWRCEALRVLHVLRGGRSGEARSDLGNSLGATCSSRQKVGASSAPTGATRTAVRRRGGRRCRGRGCGGETPPGVSATSFFGLTTKPGGSRPLKRVGTCKRCWSTQRWRLRVHRCCRAS